MAYTRLSLADGLQAVYDEVIRSLKSLESEGKYRLLESAVDLMGRHPRDGRPLKLRRSIEICPLLSNLLEKNIENYQKIVRQFLVEFMDCKCKTL